MVVVYAISFITIKVLGKAEIEVRYSPLGNLIKDI